MNEQRVDDLGGATGEARSDADLSARIADARQALAALEGRFAYIGESSQTAAQIAAAEHRLEALIAERERQARPAAEVLAEDIAERGERLEQLEERFFYIAENSQLATEIATVQGEIDALRGTLAQLQQTPEDRLAAEIAAAAEELERLEERFFYVGENPQLAAEIAAVQGRIDELRSRLAAE